MNEWQKAVGALSPADWEDIKALNAKIQSHTEPWGTVVPAKQTGEKHYEVGYSLPSPLISEFVQIWHDKGLIVPFAWPDWQEGRDWFKDKDESKYDKLDDETALKLITAIIRNDRFNEGELYRGFDDGFMQKIIDKFVTCHV